MDNIKIGNLIYQLRKEKNMTQLQLAEKLGISDKAVSKWERGLGSPDLSIMPKLSEILGVDLEKLLTGEMPPKKTVNGNMKRMLFYVCPDCARALLRSEGGDWEIDKGTKFRFPAYSASLRQTVEIAVYCEYS